MELNIKSFILMAVTLVIGVLLISGVVAPVIANVTDNGGGGGDDGPSAVFLKNYSPGDTGTITLETTDDGMTFKFNDEVLFKKPKDVAWEVPLYIYGGPDDGYEDGTAYTLVTCMNCPKHEDTYDDSTPIVSVYSYATHTFHHYNGEDHFDYEIGMSIEETTVLDITTVGDEATSRGDDAEYSYLANEGEWILTQSPTVNANDMVYLFGFAYKQSTEESWDFPVQGRGTATEFTTRDPTLYYVADGDINAEFDGTGCELDTSNTTATMNYTKTDDGITLTSLVVNAQWNDISAFEYYSTKEYTFNNFIVPYNGQPIVPSDDSGSDEGVPNTLSTLLSVIPLLLTVGLIIGAIGFLRMKN